jgi:hypothetical protein
MREGRTRRSQFLSEEEQRKGTLNSLNFSRSEQEEGRSQQPDLCRWKSSGGERTGAKRHSGDGKCVCVLHRGELISLGCGNLAQGSLPKTICVCSFFIVG